MTDIRAYAWRVSVKPSKVADGLERSPVAGRACPRTGYPAICHNELESSGSGRAV